MATLTDHIGKVQEVSFYPVKTELEQAAPAGTETLFVSDVSEFDEEGGVLEYRIYPAPPAEGEPDNSDDAGDRYTVVYTTVDEDTNTIELSTPLAHSLAEEHEIVPSPYSEEMMAIVTNEDNEESVFVSIPVSLQPLILTGVREDFQQETVVYFEDDFGDFILREVVGKTAALTLNSIRDSANGMTLEEILALNDLELADTVERLGQLDLDIAQLMVDLDANETELAALDLRLDANDDVLSQLELDLAANVQDISDVQTALAQAQQDIEDIGTSGTGNAITYSDVAPTNQTNKAGDIWYVRNNTTKRITAQYEGLGGTNWQAVTLTNVVVTTLDAGAITSGTLNAAQVSIINLSASSITSGTINANNVGIINLSASSITTGTLNAAQVAVTNLNASNITSGTINAAQVSVINLNASNITSGTMSASRITGLTISASQITSGTIDASHIGVININAANITSGSISADRIGSGTLAGIVAVTSNLFQTNPQSFIGTKINSNGITLMDGNISVLGGNLTALRLYSSSMDALSNVGGLFPVYANSSQGLLVRSTTAASSSLRYKDRIEELVDANNVYEIEPVGFHWNEGFRTEHGLPDETQLGVIVEQVEGLGFEELIMRNEEGEADAFLYERLPVVQQVAIRDLHARLLAEKERNDSLQSDVEELKRIVADLQAA
jgi:hypothetical protein